MTHEVTALQSALDGILNLGSDGSAIFYTGTRRANQLLVEADDSEDARRKIVLFASDTPGPMFHEHGAPIQGGLGADVARVRREAKRRGFVFNTFDLTEEPNEWRRFTLGLIADIAGGTYHDVEDSDRHYFTSSIP